MSIRSWSIVNKYGYNCAQCITLFSEGGQATAPNVSHLIIGHPSIDQKKYGGQMALEPNKFITYYVQADIFALIIKNYYKYLLSIQLIR